MDKKFKKKQTMKLERKLWSNKQQWLLKMKTENVSLNKYYQSISQSYHLY